MPRHNTLEDFWRQVSKDGPTQPHMDTSCWEWLSTTNRGYGSFWYNGRPHRATRLAWVFTYGEITSAEWVLHKCDFRACVRPDHLFLGDHAANMADMVRKGRSLTGVRHNSNTQPWIVPRGANHPVHRNPALVTGERNPSAILVAAQVYEIRARLLKGEGCTSLGKDYGVHKSTIYLIAKGKKWKHLL